MSDQFKIDPADFCSIDFEAFQEEMRVMQINDPKQYAILRAACIKRLTAKTIKSVYATYYALLTKGCATKADDSLDETVQFFGDTKDEGGNKITLSPNFPKQEASRIALEIATINTKFMKEQMDMLIPAQRSRDFQRAPDPSA